MSKAQTIAVQTAAEKIKATQQKVELALEKMIDIKEHVENLIDMKNDLVEQAQDTLQGINAKQKALMSKASQQLRNQMSFIDNQCKKYLGQLDDVKEDVRYYIDAQKKSVERWMDNVMKEIAKGIGKAAGSMAASLVKGAGMPEMAADAAGKAASEATSKVIAKAGQQATKAATSEMNVVKSMSDKAMDMAMSAVRTAADQAKQTLNNYMEQVIAEATAIESYTGQATALAGQAVNTIAQPLDNITNSVQRQMTKINSNANEKAEEIISKTNSVNNLA